MNQFVNLFLVLVVLVLVAVLSPAAAQQPPAGFAPAGPALQEVAEQRYLFARGMLSRGFHDMAADEFRNFLEQHPDHRLAPEAARGLIKALQASGQFAAALAQIEKTQGKWPDHKVARDVALEKGYILLQEGRTAEAETALAPLAKGDDSELKEAALYYIAQAREKQDDSQPATRIYLSLASKPLDGVHRYRPYAVYAIMTSEAENSTERAVKRMEKLLASEHVPAEVKETALMFCADSAYTRREYDVAGGLYSRLQEEFPESSRRQKALKGSLRVFQAGGDKQKTASFARRVRQDEGLANDPEVCFIEAVSLAGLGQNAAAEPLLKKVISSQSAWPALRSQAALARLRILVEMRDFSSAIAAAEDFRTAYPDHSGATEAAYLEGIARFEQEQYEKSVALLRPLAAAEGDGQVALERSLHARHLLAVSLERLGRHQAAADVYRRLAGEEPYDADRAKFLLVAAAAAEKAGDTQAAVADYERVLNGLRDEGEEKILAANALVRLSFKQGDFKRTTDILTGLVEDTAGPTRTRARLALAVAQLNADRLNECERTLQAAVNDRPRGKLATEVFFTATRLAVRMGNMQQAVDYFNRIIVMPESEWPDFESGTLLRLQEEFFRRNNYATSEKICRILLDELPADKAYIPTTRLAEILTATDRLDEAARLLEHMQAQINQHPGPGRQREAEIQSLLGEVLLKQERYDPAYRAFEESLDKGGGGMRSLARARWGMATLLKREGRLVDALRQAVGGFVIADDPFYTPRAMLIATDILIEQDKRQEAQETWRELATRYPAFAEKNPLATDQPER